MFRGMAVHGPALAAFVLCALVLAFSGSGTLAAENTLVAENAAGQEAIHKTIIKTVNAVSTVNATGATDAAADASGHKAPMSADGQKKLPRPLRVICWEGGPYTDHAAFMQGLTRELVRLGLAKRAPLPRTDETDINVHWNWLSENVWTKEFEKGEVEKGEEHGKRRALLSFPKDGFYSAGWNTRRREEVKKAIDERIRTVGDVDMIVVLDTDALFDALSLNLDIPVLAASITSPDDLIASNESNESSDASDASDDSMQKVQKVQKGKVKDNYLVLEETDRIQRLVAMAHKLFAFKKLGAVFDPGPQGRAMAGMDQLEQAARDHGFELVTCSTKLWGENAQNLRTNLTRCRDELVSKGMDALYITPTPTEGNASYMTEILEPLRRTQMPTISHRGHNEVMMGALMGPGCREQKIHGARMADIMVRIALGEHPKEIDMAHVSRSFLALNMLTALQIGWDPPLSVLSLVDEYMNSDGIWVESPDAN